MGLNTHLRVFSDARLVGVKILSQGNSKQDKATSCNGYLKTKDTVHLIYFKFYILIQLVKATNYLPINYSGEGMSF